MVRKRGEDEKSNIEQLQTQLVVQIKQTISSWKNISELTAVLTQVLFVRPNHSKGLTCLASIFHSKNPCAQICRNDASKTVAVQLMTSSRAALVP